MSRILYYNQLELDIKQKHSLDVFIEVVRFESRLKINDTYPMYNRTTKTFLSDVIIVDITNHHFSDLTNHIAYLDKGCDLKTYREILASYWSKKDLELKSELDNILYQVITFCRLDLGYFPFVKEKDLQKNEIYNPCIKGEARIIQNKLLL